MPLIALVVVIGVALGGGASLAAQDSLPGSMLWGFKIAVNENVRGAVSFGDNAKAQWDIAAVQERFAEEQRLIGIMEQERVLVDDAAAARAQAALTANFDMHVQDAAQRIQSLEAGNLAAGAADVASRLQTALGQGASALAEANVRQSAGVQAVLAPFITDVRRELDAVSDLSARAASLAP